jgi:hypothetical protein
MIITVFSYSFTNSTGQKTIEYQGLKHKLGNEVRGNQDLNLLINQIYQFVNLISKYYPKYHLGFRAKPDVLKLLLVIFLK